MTLKKKPPRQNPLKHFLPCERVIHMIEPGVNLSRPVIFLNSIGITCDG
jgi:hypothetical protein